MSRTVNLRTPLLLCVMLFLGALGAASLLWPAPALAQRQVGARPLAASIDRETILRRAKLWVDAQTPYSQYLYDTDESPVILTTPETGFRTDCSGYVAMAWGVFTDDNLPAHPNTKSLLFYATPIRQDQLQPGDAIINPTGGPVDLPVGNAYWGFAHVVLFAGWVPGTNSGYYYAYEQGGYEVDAPTSYEVNGQTVTPPDQIIPGYGKRGGARYIVLPYPYWPPYHGDPDERKYYFPVRFYGLSATKPTPTPTPSPTPTPTPTPAGSAGNCGTSTAAIIGGALVFAIWGARRQRS